MKHFIRIAFWIVTIAVFCLNTQGKPLSKRSIAVDDWKPNLFKSVSCVSVKMIFFKGFVKYLLCANKYNVFFYIYRLTVPNSMLL